jgi:hypothetical protein
MLGIFLQTLKLYGKNEGDKFHCLVILEDIGYDIITHKAPQLWVVKRTESRN